MLAYAHASPALGQEQPSPPKSDRYLIRLPAGARGEAPDSKATPEGPGQSQSPSPPPSQPAAEPTYSGRLILFFLPDTPRWVGVDPSAGPFLTAPQPIASIPVAGLREGSEIVIDTARLSDSIGTREGLEELSGDWRVQAVLDVDFTVRGHLGPGNLTTNVLNVTLSRDESDEIDLTLSGAVEPPDSAERASVASAPSPSTDPDAATAPAVEWFARPSALLTAALRRPVSLRAGVVLPYGYDDLSFPRRIWPTIYVLGDFGASHLDAEPAAAALRDPAARAAVPQAVWVYLDVSSPWGYNAFCDSDAQGPIGRALIEEFIPALEERFRLIRRSDARVLLGHGFGGWAALNLLLKEPGTFGAAFASSPEFVDFSAIGRIDLYRDASLYLARDGTDAPAVRSILGPNDDRVHLSMREQMLIERAIDPDGRSGERWAARDAMWSPWQAERDGPRAICDAASGAIDVVAGEAWSHADIARRFEQNPSVVGALLASRARILSTTRDPFYRNEAVARLRARLESWRERERAAGRTAPSGGFIELVDGLDDESLRQLATLRFHREISGFLRSMGHAESFQLDAENRATRPSGALRPRPEPQPPAGARP